MADISHVAQHVEILRHVKAEQSRLKEIEAAARAMIEDAIGDDEVGTVDGKVVVTFKHIKSNRLDQGLLKSLHPDVYEDCKAVGESRAFKVAE